MNDVIVIGGGSGGYAAAIRASQLGGKVALVETDQIGGTCVNRGCIPAKVWQRSAYLLYWIRRAEEFGIKTSVEALNLREIVAKKNGVTGDIRMGMESLLGNNGVEVIKGRALLKSPREVSVEGAVLEAKNVIVATGSRPDVPDIPGLDEAALSTDEVLDMIDPPSSALIYEGGLIAIEMATLLNTFGTKVCIATPYPRILHREDHDTSQRISQALREQGAEVLPRFTLKSLQKAAAGFEAVLSGSQERNLAVERVLVSSRKPNTERLGLEEAGVRLKDDGSIEINDRLETSAKGVFAIGDAAGGWMLSHVASSMAVIAAENAMGKPGSYPFHLIPRGLWTIPEVGAVGISEEEAEKAGYDIEVGDFPYSINGLAMARNEVDGAVKIISDSRYGEILGVHIVGANATDLIGEAVLAMQYEGTVRSWAKSIRVHPTFSETVVDAARDAANWALYLPRR